MSETGSFGKTMKFKSPLLPGILVQRYKRFLIDIETSEGTIITAHCPTSGSMKSLNMPGLKVWYSVSSNATRKLPYTLEVVETVEGEKVGINTQYPCQIFSESIKNNLVPEFLAYKIVKPEITINPTCRLDFLLESERGLAYVEIKNVTLRHRNQLVFPDAMTTRGAKHLMELMKLAETGHEAMMFYIAQRSDGDSFSIEKNIDPLYFEHFKAAQKAGVRMIAYKCNLSLQEITLSHSIPVEV